MNYFPFLLFGGIFLLSMCGENHQVKSQFFGATIVPDLLNLCTQDPGKSVNLMLDIPSLPEVFSPLTSGNEDKASILKSSLMKSTQEAQKLLLSTLRLFEPVSTLEITPYWIVNRIGIKEVRCTILTSLAGVLAPLPTLTLRKELVHQLDFISPEENSLTRAAVPIGSGPQWGVAKINAPGVWNTTKGKGVIVATIDSGVRGTHAALAGNYRSSFGWLDGFTNSSDGGPNDGNGHGTHTMGSIAGGLGIGVAPEASWIACKGCGADGSCDESALLTCGQWMFCPYTKTGNGPETQNCSARPQLVSNSWGGLFGSSPFYNGVINNWIKVGIVPIFALGNLGPLCFTSGAPGNQDNVISVGATDDTDAIARYSSKGPTISFKMKPEVSAPGTNIFSSWNSNDTAYNTISGTSMATPHVAGAVALLLAKNSNLTLTQIASALENTAFRPSLGFNAIMCKTSLSEWPNNVYGYGRIDALAAFNSVKSPN